MNSVGHFLKQELLNTISPLAYFSRFQTPLTKQEIFYHLPEKVSQNELDERLQYLCDLKILSMQSGYYFLSKDYNPEWISNKIEGHKNANKVLAKAKLYSGIIRLFPFVRGIYLSGSLSKDYFDKNSDVDYFIITKPGRLWLCRSLLIAFKKIFLLNSRKYFCVNYFIDSDHLLVPDQNVFVATEILHLVPAWNLSLLQSFHDSNKWVHKYLPQLEGKKNTLIKSNKQSTIQKAGEFLFSGFIGEKLDNLFFKMTLNRWKNKFPHFTESDFDLHLRTRKNVSKHHPRGYQQIVLDHYNKTMEEIKNLLQ